MKNLVLVLALLLSATIPALAQSNKSRIVDIDGRGAPDVMITGTSFCAISAPPFVSRLPLIYASTAPVWTSVSAASFSANVNGALTPGMIAAGFGSGLAEFTEFTGPVLPETLANRRILVRDSAGVEKPARLFFVAPTQINYLMPEGLQDGAMVVKLMSSSNELIKTDLGKFESIAPGVFTANSDGDGVPAAFVTRVKPGNEQITEPVAQLDVAQGRFVPLPIDLGPETEFVVLTLFGTGWTPNTGIVMA